MYPLKLDRVMGCDPDSDAERDSRRCEACSTEDDWQVIQKAPTSSCCMQKRREARKEMLEPDIGSKGPGQSRSRQRKRECNLLGQCASQQVSVGRRVRGEPAALLSGHAAVVQAGCGRL